MILSIHQPNFFPYYGVFQKIEQSDVHVILSHCQFEKNNYQNRFNIDDNWYTMSVYAGMEKTIYDKKYFNPYNDWDNVKKKLPEYKNVLEKFDHCISEGVAKTNTCIIEKICFMIGLKTEIRHDWPTNLRGSERLLSICLVYGATTYLSGISGKNYLNIKIFEENGINVIFQDENKIIKKPIITIL